mgnify:CR=1 FL=1
MCRSTPTTSRAARAALRLLPVLIALAGCGREAGAPEPATGPAEIVVYSALTQERTLAIADAYRQATGTTSKPAMTALAGLVPWAEVGMRQMLRSLSPRCA